MNLVKATAFGNELLFIFHFSTLQLNDEGMRASIDDKPVALYEHKPVPSRALITTRYGEDIQRQQYLSWGWNFESTAIIHAYCKTQVQA